MNFPNHRVVIGNSSENLNFPKNEQNTSLFNYVKLLGKVLISEINSFYTLYFLILGILQSLPGDLTSTESWTTFVPLIIVIVLSYLIQAVDYGKTISAVRGNQKEFYRVIRDHQEISLQARKIMPGDIIIIDDSKSLPCDCVLLKTDHISVFFDTSTIDGETHKKDRFPVRLPDNLSNQDILNINGIVESTPPENDTREITGSILITGLPENIVNQTLQSLHSLSNPQLLKKDEKKDDESEENNDKNEDDEDDDDDDDERFVGKFELKANGELTTGIVPLNFVERGSKVSTTGVHYFIALYTGKHCRSGSDSYNFVTRKTIIDDYLEKLSITVFCLQFIISVILGGLGYYYLRRDNPKNSTSITYIGEIDVYGYGEFFVCLIIITRHFLLLAFLIPITLKIILPVFRYVYGLFIAYDLNFVEPTDVQTADRNKEHNNLNSDEQRCAKAYSTNITENLGSIDVIVADKTGTLTKNSLELVSILVGDQRFGDNNEAASIQEDSSFKEKLQNPGDDKYFIEMIHALSLCHSVAIDDNKEFIGSSADELAIVKGLFKLNVGITRLSQDRIKFEAPFGTSEYRILRICPFNRKRMRMSIVVQCDDGIYVYMKGAPERVTRKCKGFSGQEAAMFEQFQKKGLRTMSVSYRKLDEYSPDMTTAQLEEEQFFLGTIGIEDALQQDAQITVDVLQNASIKIWVATGDAAVNTLVTTAMLKLLHPSDQLIHLQDNALRSDLNDFSQRAMRVPENSFTVLVACESDQVVQNALQNDDFIDALYRARCAIFYRCKPQTKADIVLALRKTGRRVLAVGDGANDTHLLRNADVGIGMLGQDGKASFTSCDFAVPSFRSLSRLILIHGHYSLHRSVLSVHFSFYKALQFSICQAVYQYWTGFSGQSFFGSLSLVTFNQVWTLIPMIAILFEKDVSENFLYKKSSLYNQLRHPLTIDWKHLTWMYLAILQGLAVMLVAYALTGEAFLQADTGKDLGRDFLSIIVYFAEVIIVTFYLVTQLNVLTYYSLILLVGNLLLLVAFSGIFQSSWLLDQTGLGRDWQGFFGECFNSWPAILILITIVLAASTPAWLIQSLWNEMTQKDTLLVIEKETIAAKEDQPLFFDPPKTN